VREELQKALSDAFNPMTLQRMLEFKLHKDIYDFGAVGLGADKQSLIFNLVDAAFREGFVNDLVIGAREFNPGNEALHELALSLGFVSTRTSKQERERIIDEAKSNLSPTSFREKIFQAEIRVCRLEIPAPEGKTAKGSGFLVAPALVMTNRHVVESLLDHGCDPAAARARFDYKAGTDNVTVQAGSVLKFAQQWLVDASEEGPYGDEVLPQPHELDYAIVRLEKVPPQVGGVDRGYYQIPEQHAKLAEDAPLFIMQHPSGRPLELALDMKAGIGENPNGTRVRYRTNTEPGSSGSPCFTPDFELVALHHSGDPDFDPAHKPTYNEGIPMRAIATLLRKNGKAAELGL
jgi:V8-like Glu-specific endopeptidase